MNSRLLLMLTIIGAAAASRVLPHPPNFTPITAIALFGAANFERKWLAYLAPLLAVLLSDLALGVLTDNGLLGGWLAGGGGLHGGSWVVYSCFALVTTLGLVLRRRNGPAMLAGTTLVASTLFFAASNFLVWLGSDGQLYPPTVAGLLACYTAALPFFQNMLIGDACYVTAIFGAFALAQRAAPSMRQTEDRMVAA